MQRTWALEPFSPGAKPFPTCPISQELSDPRVLGPPHGGEGMRSRGGRRDLLKATGRCRVGMRRRFSDSVPRALHSRRPSRPSFWKPTQFAWAEWPAVAAHLPGRPLETWSWGLAGVWPGRGQGDGCGAGQGQGARGGNGETPVLALSVLRTSMCENQSSSSTSLDGAQISQVPYGELCGWWADPTAALGEFTSNCGSHLGSPGQQNRSTGQKRRKNLWVAPWRWDSDPLESLFPHW